MGSNKLWAKLRVGSRNDQGLFSGVDSRLPAANAIARAAALAVGGAAATVLGAVLGSGAMAAPKDGVVRQGQATITQGVLETSVVQRSDRAIIDWRSMDLRSFESLRFYQPAASSMTLNRVTGGAPSQILGNITANGNVLLVNPQGIVFGPSSRINVGGLVATTANIADDGFMQGGNVLRFDQAGSATGQVVQQGTVTVAQGGLAAFVARQVRNEGYVSGRLSRVAMAGADRFVLDLAGDSLIRLTLDRSALEQTQDAQGRPLSARVDQSGQVRAEGGRIELRAGTVDQLLDNAIHVKGDMRAVAVEGRGGVIRLIGEGSTDVEVSGVLQAGGGGSTMTLSGRDVTVQASAQVDLSLGTGLDVSASQDVRVAAQLDARGTVSTKGGGVLLRAGRDVRFERSLFSNDAPLVVDAGRELHVAAGQQLDSGSAETRLEGLRGVSLDGTLVTTGDIRLGSRLGAVTSTTPIAGLGSVSARSLEVLSGAGLSLAGARVGAGGIRLQASGGDVLSSAPLVAEGSVRLVADNGAVGRPGEMVSVVSTLAAGPEAAVEIQGAAGVRLATLQTPGQVLIRSGADVILASAFSAPSTGSSVALADMPPLYRLGIDAPGKLVLSGGTVGAGGLVVGESTVPAELYLVSGADLISTGPIRLRARGLVGLTSAVVARGSVEVSSQAGDLTVGRSGITAQGEGAGIALRANGDLRLEGSLRATQGSIALTSDRGDITARVAAAGGDPVATDALLIAGTGAGARIDIRAPGGPAIGGQVTLGGMQAGDTVSIEAGRDVRLLSSLGGTQTGYTGSTAATGYQSELQTASGVIDNRPQVGRLVIRAGSAELNGLNLDGSRSADSAQWGLDVEVRDILLSNGMIAVNKGGIRLVSTSTGEATPGSSTGCDTDCARAGVYLGNDVVARGYDARNADGVVVRRTYPVTIQGRRLVLFDNGTGTAEVPDLFETPLFSGARLPPSIVYVDFGGRVLDAATGLPRTTSVATATGAAQTVSNVVATYDSLYRWERTANGVSQVIFTSSSRTINGSGQAVYRIVDPTTGKYATADGSPVLVASPTPSGESTDTGWTTTSVNQNGINVMLPRLTRPELANLGYAVDELQFSSDVLVAQIGTPVLRNIAKITIGNQGLNYADSASGTGSSTGGSNVPAPLVQGSSFITLSGARSGDALDVVGNASLAPGRHGLAEVRTAPVSAETLDRVVNRIESSDAGATVTGAGIGLKLLTSSVDAATAPDASSTFWFENLGLFNQSLSNDELLGLLQKSGIRADQVNLVTFSRRSSPVLKLSRPLTTGGTASITAVERPSDGGDYELTSGTFEFGQPQPFNRIDFGVALTRSYVRPDKSQGVAVLPLFDLPANSQIDLTLQMIDGTNGKLAKATAIRMSDTILNKLASIGPGENNVWLAGSDWYLSSNAGGLNSGSTSSTQTDTWSQLTPGSYVPLTPAVTRFDNNNRLKLNYQPGSIANLKGSVAIEYPSAGAFGAGRSVVATDGQPIDSSFLWRRTATGPLRFVSQSPNGIWQADSGQGEERVAATLIGSSARWEYNSLGVLVRSSLDSAGLIPSSTQALVFPSMLQNSGLSSSFDNALNGTLTKSVEAQTSRATTQTAFGFPAIGPVSASGSVQALSTPAGATAAPALVAPNRQVESTATSAGSPVAVVSATSASEMFRGELSAFGQRDASGASDGASTSTQAPDRSPVCAFQPRSSASLDLGRAGTQPGSLPSPELRSKREGVPGLGAGALQVVSDPCRR